MKVKLVIQLGKKEGRSFKIRPPEGVIGRSHGIAVRVPSNDVSRKHCRVCINDTTVTVEDLQSVNGTFINDEKVEGVQEVQEGDRLRVGPVTFLVKIESAAKVVQEDVDVDLLSDEDRQPDEDEDQKLIDEATAGMELFPEEQLARPKKNDGSSRKNQKLPQEQKKPEKKKVTVRDDAPIPLIGTESPDDAPIPLADVPGKKKEEPIYVDFDQAWVPPDAGAFRDILQGLVEGEKVEGEDE
jgi:pSer/pThr/pTyr-binding forkhead associated (FHA) protein